jgi:hypothetical protein
MSLCAGTAGSRWEMRFRDGSAAWFKSCEKPAEVCSLVERADGDGRRRA